MGTIVRGTPRQCDVMVVAGTITVKMAPRVKKLWDQMPEPKWCIAMGSCAISGDFYRDIYSVVPGIDTFLPVDVYVPGLPAEPGRADARPAALAGKSAAVRSGQWREREERPATSEYLRTPNLPRMGDPSRPPELSELQTLSAGSLSRGADLNLVQVRRQQVGQGAVCAPGEERRGRRQGGWLMPAKGIAVNEEFEALLRDEFGVADFPDDAPPLVAREQHLELARKLRSEWLPHLRDGGGDALLAQEETKKQPCSRRSATRSPRRSGTSGAGAKLALWRCEVPMGESIDSLANLLSPAQTGRSASSTTWWASTSTVIRICGG